MKFIKKFSSIEEYEAAELSYPATSLVSGTVIYDKELTPQYRTLTTATTCVGYDKYVLEEYQVSMDRGKTWTTTGTSATTLIETDSEDCGYVPPVSAPKWLATYSDSHTESAECDSSSAITDSEINKTDLVSLEIGDCVTTIGNYAFSDCSSLTSVTIPNSVTSIGEAAFAECISLTSVTIPDSVTSISAYAFSNCGGLTSITIGSGVTTIGHEAFNDCSSVSTLTIPSSVTEIGFWCFTRMNALQSVTFEGDLPTIGDDETSALFHDYTPPVIYVPQQYLSDYRSCTYMSDDENFDPQSQIQAIQ